jgi:hypothetical protein
MPLAPEQGDERCERETCKLDERSRPQKIDVKLKSMP